MTERQKKKKKKKKKKIHTHNLICWWQYNNVKVAWISSDMLKRVLHTDDNENIIVRTDLTI